VFADYLLVSTSILGLATWKTLGTIPARVVNKLSDMSSGSSNCKVLKWAIQLKT